jgi:anti-sigma-K factor RskA
MKYDDPRLRDLLAGEYVLGSLRGRARARFTRLLAADTGLRKLVRAWEDRLTPLAEETEAVVPPARVFLALKARLDGAARERAPTLWQRLGFWRMVSASAATLAIVLGVWLGATQLRPPAPGPGPSYVAVLQDDTARPVLVVTAYVKPSWRLDVEPLAPLSGTAPRTLQVWAVERATGATRPLVAVASDRPQRIALDEAAWKLVKGAESLIVTVASADGVAPQLSEPVLYRGPCINLKGGSAS